MDDELLLRRPEPLALPFAVLGAVTCLFVFDLQHTLRHVVSSLCIDGAEELLQAAKPDWAERASSSAVAAVSFALAGKWSASRIAEGARPWLVTMMGCIAATQLPAALVGLMSMGMLWGRLMFLGLLVSLLCAPSAVLVGNGAGAAWLSRPHSLLLSAYRRAIWLDVAIFSVVFTALYANPMFGAAWSAGQDRSIVAKAIVLAGTIVGLVAGGLAVKSWRVLGDARRRCSKDDSPLVDDSHAIVLDLGVGDELRRDVSGQGSAYRSRRESRAVVKGDVARALGSLRWAMVRAALVVTTGAVVLVFDGGPYTVSWPSPFC